MLEEALEVENIDDVGKVGWLGDGATGNWTLADAARSCILVPSQWIDGDERTDHAAARR